jgi:hypothetical protein
MNIRLRNEKTVEDSSSAKLRLVFCSAFAVLLLVSSIASTAAAQVTSFPWLIKKDHWSAIDEENYSKFVESIYQSRCNTVVRCMNGSGNWYRDRDPEGIEWFADCGRFPYLLRAYFALHNNLPFQAAVEVDQRDPNDPNPILQYTARGNVVTRRTAARSGVDGYRFLLRLMNSVYSALYRVDPRLDVSTNQFGDFYHVAIDRDYIRPGTVVYDPNGHVALVAKVTNEGRVILLDSHPDNTVSRVPYTGAFRATSPIQGGGFKNWRPVQLVNAQVAADGALYNGTLVTLANNQSPGYSLEQFTGDQPNARGGFFTAHWKTSEGILGANQYADVIRARLTVGAVIYNALKEVNDGVDTLCGMIQDRIQSVQTALNNRVDEREMPNGRMPMNIYGAAGEWESFSSPSRDARLKAAVAEYRALLDRIVTLGKAGSNKIVYRGTNLVGDMLKTYDAAARRCSIAYQKSNGAMQPLSFQEVIARLYKMSFDPYHCVELRWGASSDAELATCTSRTPEKMAWYAAEQRIRNSLERKYDKRMGWSLEELSNRADMDDANPANSVGSDRQTPLDPRKVLLSAQ